MNMVDKQQCDRQRSGLLLFLFYIGWWFHKVEKIMATGSTDLWRRTSKSVIAFLMVSMLALVNMAAVEARTVTIDLDQLKDRDGSEADGWNLSNGTKYQMTIGAKNKKCIFQGNVSLRHIAVESYNSTFTIEVQGKLTVRNTEDKPAIGISGKSVALIIMGSGTLDAITEAVYCPGIGGYRANGKKAAYDNGTLIIKSGTVNAMGGEYGCGIGGGGSPYSESSITDAGSGGTIQIEGGTVNATGKGGAAGIGGMYLQTGGTVTVYSVDGAGIGGGMAMQSLGSININVKSIDSFSENGAAIGGGKDGGSYTDGFYLYGGNVKAYSINGFGIGEGANSNNLNDTYVYLGYSTESGKLNADIHSVNNYAIDKFYSYYGTSRIKSDTKVCDMDTYHSGVDGQRPKINGGSVYMSKPMIKAWDNYGVDLYQVKVRAFGLSDDRDYQCSYIVKKRLYSTRHVPSMPVPSTDIFISGCVKMRMWEK